jgi:hypothetical protein
VSQSWSEWLKEWTETVYEPHFAPMGIDKGTALLSCQIQMLSNALHALPEAQGAALRKAAKEMEMAEEMWRRPET